MIKFGMLVRIVEDDFYGGNEGVVTDVSLKPVGNPDATGSDMYKVSFRMFESTVDRWFSVENLVKSLE